MMYRSPYFHRDPADAFYTDRDEDPAECPICGALVDELQSGLFCPDCNITYDDRRELARIAADLAAAPFHEDARGHNTTVAEGLARWTR